jgi:hypothetical protein
VAVFSRLGWVQAVATGAALSGVLAVVLSTGSLGAARRALRLGPIVALSGPGEDAEFPALAVNRGGDYVLVWPDQQLFGPFSALSGVLPGGLSRRNVRKYGNRSDVAPTPVAVAPDGRRALDYAVRGEPPPTNIWGLDRATLAPHAKAWTVQKLVRPTHALDPEESGAPLFDSQSMWLDSWVLDHGMDSSLVLARQRGRREIRARSVFTDRTGGGIYRRLVALDGANRPVIAWSRREVRCGASASRPARPGRTCHPVPQAAMVMASDKLGRLRAPQLLRTGCDLESLAMAPSGEAAVALVCDRAAKQFRIFVSERAPGGKFGRPRLASGSGSNEFAPSLSIARDGRIWLTWLHRLSFNPNNGHEQVRAQVTRVSLGEGFSAARWITRYQNQEAAPVLMEGPAGTMYLLREGDGSRLTIRRLETGGHLGPVTQLSPHIVFAPQVAVDPAGHGIAVWDRASRTMHEIQARTFTLSQ